MAFETRKSDPVLSVPAERLPAMCGSATLAMLVLQHLTNVARVTANAMTQGLTAGRGKAEPSAVRAAELI